MKLDRPQYPTLPVHDYRSALEVARTWLGDRYLLAQPVNRVSAQRGPNFAETRGCMPDARH